MVKSMCRGRQPSVSLPWVVDDILNFLVVLIWPGQGALSGLLCLWMPTTLEKEDPLKLLVKCLTLGPLYAALFLLALPLALCAIPLRCLLSSIKKPFRYSVCKKDHTQAEEEVMMKHLSNSGLGAHQFGIASSNVCLCGEFFCRINNLSHAKQRARAIGERTVVDQFFYRSAPKADSSFSGLGTKKEDATKPAKEVAGITGGLTTHFPHLDFLCLQEVSDWNYNKTLRQELHKVFPYILHDVGVWSMRSNYYFLNSGLMLASRHPVLEVDFKFYPHSIFPFLFMSIGLLMVKVLIGEETDSRRQVGYIYTTHLQAYQGKEPILVHQLDNIVEWTAEFRRKTADSKDVVLFDILCGDFNFDNISPGDKENRDHGLFDVYHDPCRVKPGQDQAWTVGTEFRQTYMLESMAASPDSLKASLSDPVLRHRYLVDANVVEPSIHMVNAKLRTDEHGNIVTFPEAGMRRIDYILTRKDTPVDITGFQFVTRLASLTDHIPVAMTFKVRV